MANVDRQGVWEGVGAYPVDVAADGSVRPAPLTLLASSDVRASADHMARVIERYEELKGREAGEAIEARARSIQVKAPGSQRWALIRAASQARTNKQRIEWLRREADLVVQAAQGQSACHEGCSSCCHLAVAVTEHEARLIAKETRLPLKADGKQDRISLDVRDLSQLSEQTQVAAQWGDRQGRDWKGVPCPFLDTSDGTGRCSIYKQSRPLACRHLINLDRDNLLCTLVDGVEVNVPYLARTDAKAASLGILGGVVRVADIRDWFGSDPLWPSLRPAC